MRRPVPPVPATPPPRLVDVIITDHTKEEQETDERLTFIRKLDDLDWEPFCAAFREKLEIPVNMKVIFRMKLKWGEGHRTFTISDKADWDAAVDRLKTSTEAELTVHCE